MKRDEFADADWPVLARYLSGESSDDETRAVESWIASRPGRAQAVERLRDAWQRAAVLPSGEDVERSFRRVSQRVPLGRMRASRGVAPRFTITHERRLSRAVRAGLPIAASVVLAFSAWLTWGRPGHRPGPRQGAQAREYVTERSHFTTIVLSDGNRVTLGSGSRLTVPADYGTLTRTVALEGDASFIVAFDARRPFRVRTPTTMTEDLGTQFVVRAGLRDSAVDVGVAEGRVVLLPDSSGTGQRVVLGAGQVGRIARSGLVTVTGGVNVGLFVRWMKGDLVFHKTPLEEVRGVLERWYGVRIELPDTSLAALPVTASLRDMSSEEALGRLASLLDYQYTRRGDVVRFEYRSAHKEGSGT